MRVAVVGAGLAGLSAARELAAGGTCSFGGAGHAAVFASGVEAACRVMAAAPAAA
jgi:uncharacterized protein with NAD-binding domain and iron-sulfur cluster